MNEEKAVAILLANIKGKKNKPTKLTEIAKACKYLLDKWGLKKTADFLEVSEYQLTQINKINELSNPIRKIIDEGNLGIDSAYQIWRLKKDIREKVAKESIGLTSHEIRQMVYLLLKNEDMTVEIAKQLTKKDLRKNFNIIQIPLSVQTYSKLLKHAKKKHIPLTKFIVNLVEAYVERK